MSRPARSLNRTLAAAAVTLSLVLVGAAPAGALVIPKRSIDSVRLRDSEARVARLHGSRPERAAITFGPGEVAAVQWTYPRRKLRIVFIRHRVVEVETQSRRQRTSRGVGVGTSFEQARRAHPELKCYTTFCEWGTGTSIRTLRFTQLAFSNGRVTRIVLGYSTP